MASPITWKTNSWFRADEEVRSASGKRTFSNIPVDMLAGWIMGFLGSLHCVGMCGPLAVVIHEQARSQGRQPWTGMALYHLGRVSTYVVLGILIGFISTALWGVMQFWLSLLAGVVLILSAFSLLPWERQMWSLPGFRWIGQRIPVLYARFLNHPSAFAPFLGGAVNGLLPCGLVYLALSAGLATGDILLSARLMFFFGLGTIPALAFTQVAGWKARLRLTAVRRYVLPVFLILTGGFLILRAFSVPIPTDLRLLQEMTKVPMCH